MNKFLEILKENPIENYYSISLMKKLIPLADGKLAYYHEDGSEQLFEKNDNDVVCVRFNEKLYERFLKVYANIMTSRGLKQDIDENDLIVKQYARKHFGSKPSNIQLQSIVHQAQREMNPYILAVMAQVMSYIALGSSLFVSKDETKYELYEPFFNKTKNSLQISKKYIDYILSMVKKEVVEDGEEYLDIFDDDGDLEPVYLPVIRQTNKQELNIAIVEGFIVENEEFGEFIRSTEIARLVTMSIAIMNHENRQPDDVLDISEDSFRRLVDDVFRDDEGEPAR